MGVAVGGITGVYGDLGAGKSGWVTAYLWEQQKKYRCLPLISTVPVITPQRGALFLARDVGDYLAGALVLTRFVWSEQAKILAKIPKGWLGRKVRKFPISYREVDDIFTRLQAEYRAVAQQIDWKASTSIDKFVVAHDYLVANNLLGKKSMLEVGQEAVSLMEEGFYNLSFQFWGNHRFDYLKPYLPFVMFLDELGVSASADDNEALKASAFYDILAQLRKFGGNILYTGHHPSRVFKQLREITNIHYKVKYWDFPIINHRLYYMQGYLSEDRYAEGLRPDKQRLWTVPIPILSRYPTYWIVRPPRDSEAESKELRKRRR